jgi:hypothetical protein
LAWPEQQLDKQALRLGMIPTDARQRRRINLLDRFRRLQHVQQLRRLLVVPFSPPRRNLAVARPCHCRHE